MKILIIAAGLFVSTMNNLTAASADGDLAYRNIIIYDTRRDSVVVSTYAPPSATKFLGIALPFSVSAPLDLQVSRQAVDKWNKRTSHLKETKTDSLRVPQADIPVLPHEEVAVIRVIDDLVYICITARFKTKAKPDDVLMATLRMPTAERNRARLVQLLVDKNLEAKRVEATPTSLLGTVADALTGSGSQLGIFDGVLPSVGSLFRGW